MTEAKDIAEVTIALQGLLNELKMLARRGNPPVDDVSQMRTLLIQIANAAITGYRVLQDT